MGRKAALLESLLAAAMVLVVVTQVLLPVLGQGGLGVLDGHELRVELLLVQPLEGLPGLQPAAAESVDVMGPPLFQAVLLDPTPVERAGLLGGELVQGLTVLGVLGLLLQITRTLVRGEVFAPANARRLGLLALLVGTGGMASQLLTTVGTVRAVDEAFVLGSANPVFELSFLPLFAALLIAVLAEVFRQGARLREDVRGLV